MASPLALTLLIVALAADDAGDADAEVERPRASLPHALAGAGVPLFLAGGAMAVYGSSQYDEQLLADPGECSGPAAVACRDSLASSVDLRTAGFALIGASLGLSGAALTADLEAPRVVYLAEMGVGAGLGAAGIAWLAVNTLQTNRSLGAVDNSEAAWLAIDETLASLPGQRVAAAAVLGLGSGLLVGALAGLLVDRRTRRRLRAGPLGAPGGLGLSLAGDF